MPGFKGGTVLESVKPLPKLNREIPEKMKLPKGMVPANNWDRKKAKGQSFKKVK